MRAMLLSLAVAASSLLAQRSSLNPIGGGGNVLQPGIPRNVGGVSPGGYVGGVRTAPGVQGPGLASSMIPLGGTSVFGGNYGGTRGGFGGARRFGGGGSLIVPYPIYGGGYTVVHNPPPGQYDPIFGVYNPGAFAQGYPGEPAPSAPVVVINQDFKTETVNPQFRDYSNAQLPPPGPNYQRGPMVGEPPAPQAGVQSADTPLLLVAMKDHTIYPARAYWVEGTTLNYITVDGIVNHISLDQVDRELSLKLNGERGLGFTLP
jgi:hypothetical protein